MHLHCVHNSPVSYIFIYLHCVKSVRKVLFWSVFCIWTEYGPKLLRKRTLLTQVCILPYFLNTYLYPIINADLAKQPCARKLREMVYRWTYSSNPFTLRIGGNWLILIMTSLIRTGILVDNLWSENINFVLQISFFYT